MCGNGRLELGEECDDNNTISGDGCNASCANEVAAVCGDGILQAGEQCDDGNQFNDDGCSSQCQNEPPRSTSWRCAAAVRWSDPSCFLVQCVAMASRSPASSATTATWTLATAAALFAS